MTNAIHMPLTALELASRSPSPLSIEMPARHIAGYEDNERAGIFLASALFGSPARHRFAETRDGEWLLRNAVDSSGNYLWLQSIGDLEQISATLVNDMPDVAGSHKTIWFLLRKSDVGLAIPIAKQVNGSSFWLKRILDAESEDPRLDEFMWLTNQAVSL